MSGELEPEPPRDCQACARLVEYRQSNRASHPHWFNAPVESFGAATAHLLIVGLAPGLQGANRTGRPFTGDYAGVLLYQTLLDSGFAEGRYEAAPDDNLRLNACMITNAVRCAPPANKPTGAEIKACRKFLSDRITALPALRAILALGRVAHESVVAARNQKQTAFAFAHGARHALPGGLMLYDSYHCSRYNTNTGRLTDRMFRDVLNKIRADLSE